MGKLAFARGCGLLFVASALDIVLHCTAIGANLCLVKATQMVVVSGGTAHASTSLAVGQAVFHMLRIFFVLPRPQVISTGLIPLIIIIISLIR